MHQFYIAQKYKKQNHRPANSLVNAMTNLSLHVAENQNNQTIDGPQKPQTVSHPEEKPPYSKKEPTRYIQKLQEFRRQRSAEYN